MPNYDFSVDLPIAIQTEKQIATILCNKYNAVILEFGKNSKYDIKAKINNKIFTFEIKEDFTCEKTGNVGLEFECRGRPSGIQTSKADFYIYKIHTKSEGIQIFLYKTNTIKNMVKQKLYFKVVNGGDKGSNSMNYLFKYDIFTAWGKLIFPP